MDDAVSVARLVTPAKPASSTVYHEGSEITKITKRIPYSGIFVTSRGFVSRDEPS